MSAMQAGFASVCITPIPGKDIPGLFESRSAARTHDNLFVRAVALENHQRIALVQWTPSWCRNRWW